MVVVTATLVILLRNSMHSAMALLGTFLGVAAMYALLNAPFLAAIQVMVCAGTIIVLFVFIIMQLNLSGEDFEDAIEDAIGVRMTDLPMSPPRILAALEDKL